MRSLLVALVLAVPAVADGPVVVVQQAPPVVIHAAPPVVLVPRQMPPKITATTTYTVTPGQVYYVPAPAVGAGGCPLLGKLQRMKAVLMGCQ